MQFETIVDFALKRLPENEMKILEKEIMEDDFAFMTLMGLQDFIIRNNASRQDIMEYVETLKPSGLSGVEPGQTATTMNTIASNATTSVSVAKIIAIVLVSGCLICTAVLGSKLLHVGNSANHAPTQILTSLTASNEVEKNKTNLKIQDEELSGGVFMDTANDNTSTSFTPLDTNAYAGSSSKLDASPRNPINNSSAIQDGEDDTGNNPDNGSPKVGIPLTQPTPYKMQEARMPEFPGGDSARTMFLENHLIYPDSARMAQINDTVKVKMRIQADGSITILSIVKSVGFGCDVEALRVIGLMPNWIPGKQGDNFVPVNIVLPILFKLE